MIFTILFVFAMDSQNVCAQEGIVIEENYVGKVNDEIIITAVVHTSKTSLGDISWHQYADGRGKFSATSTQPPSVTGKKDVWWVSTTFKPENNGSYLIELRITGIGTALTRVYVNNLYKETLHSITQDAEESIASTSIGSFRISNECDLHAVKGKTDIEVLFDGSCGEITHIIPAEGAVVPKMHLRAEPDSFRYENGAYNTEKLNISVSIKCEPSLGCPFSTKALSDVSLGVTLKSFSLQLTSSHLNFGQTGLIIQHDVSSVSQENIWIDAGNEVINNYEVFVKKGFVPDTNNECISLSGKICIEESSSDIVQDSLILQIINLDVQKVQAENAKKEKEIYSQITSAKAQLKQLTAVALDANLSAYCSSEQIQEMEDYLVVYITKVLAVDQFENKSFFDNLASEAVEKVKKKLISKMHLSSTAFLGSKSVKGTTMIGCSANTGEKITITFTVKLDQYTLGDRDPYSMMAAIEYKTLVDGKTLTGTGMATLADMESFAESVMDLLKYGYNEAWGKEANKIAAMFDAKPIDWLLDGDYSGNLYELLRSAAKNVPTKRVSIQCPVDVSVFDEMGNLCVQIVDGEVLSTSECISAVVNDDEKNLYLSGGDYSICIEATDNGYMTYTVEEAKEGAVYRTYKQSSVPLKKGYQYETLVPEDAGIRSEIYAITDQDDKVLGIQTDTQKEIEPEPVSIGMHWELVDGSKLVLFGEGSTGYYMDDPPWQEYADQIESAEVQPGFTEIGYATFYELENLSEVILPSTIKTIEDWTFTRCTSLESIILPEGLTKIGYAAFRGCISLKDCSLPESLTSVGKFCFAGAGFEEIHLNENLYDIGSYAFESDYLQKVTVSCRYLKYALSDALGRSPQLKQIYVASTVKNLNETLGAVGSVNVEIFDVAQDNPYYCSIDGILFSKDKTRLVSFPCGRSGSYTMPENVLSISDYAFSESKITAININEQLNNIGKYAFEYCYDLTELDLPDSVLTMGKGALYFCKSLEKLHLPASLTVIPEAACSMCQKLTQINIPESVEEIGNSAFWNTGLNKDIYLGNSVKRIGDEAFAWTEIRKVEITGSLEYLGQGALDIDSGKITICFYGEKPQFSKRVFSSRIASQSTISIFYRENESWTEDDKNLFIGGVREDVLVKWIPLENGDHSDKIILPASLSRIESEAFSNLNQIVYIVISDNVTFIAEDAFSESNVTILCPKGSYAEQFCKLKGVDYVHLPD